MPFISFHLSYNDFTSELQLSFASVTEPEFLDLDLLVMIPPRVNELGASALAASSDAGNGNRAQTGLVAANQCVV